MSGAHYEAEVERDGVNVRVVIDFTHEARNRYGADVDENGEHAGGQASRIAREVIARGEVPF